MYMETKMETNDFFRQVTIRICGNLDINTALANTFDYLQTVMPADGLVLTYLDAPGSKIVSVARVRKEEAKTIFRDEAQEIRLGTDLIDLIKDNEDQIVQIINNPDSLPSGILNLFPQLASSSLLTLQLKINGEMVGKFLVGAEGLNRYTMEHADLLKTVREPIAIALSNARRYRELQQAKENLADDNKTLTDELKRFTRIKVIGGEYGLKEVMHQVQQVAESNIPILLLGETGTGKEVIANAIHTASRKQQGPLVTMQCGAVPDSLLDNELFGHEKGAFTGASETQKGRFERADKGTLFLDEIGELSLEAQVKLLRVLQEKQFERVGGTATIKVDVRVIVATHRDLNTMVQQGTFREDLWYRLNVFPIRIPPLRERREDIADLVQYFVSRHAREINLRKVPVIDEMEIKRLEHYDWPGNVRELQNVVERALLVAKRDQTHLSFSPLLSNSPRKETILSTTPPLGDLSLDEAMKNHIRQVLNNVNGKIDGPGGAAELLQLHPSTLRFRMKKLGIERTTRF